MKAVVYDAYGPPEVMRIGEVETPTPKADEVRVRVRAAGVVLGDSELRTMAFPLWFRYLFRLYAGVTRPKRIRIMGQELAGDIDAVGDAVTRFKVGDPVYAPTDVRFAAQAEYRCLREKAPIAIKPSNMTYEEAATVPTGGLNALHYIRMCEIGPGEQVAVVGAAGNLGMFGVQLAKYFGAEVTGVDRGDKLDMVRSIGADHVIDYTKQDFTQSGKKYDVVFDGPGKSRYGATLGVLKPGGRYALANPKFFQMLRTPLSTWFGDRRVMFRFAPYTSEALEFLRERIEAGDLRTVIDKHYPWEQIVDAHRYIDTGDKAGNVAITIQAAADPR